MSTEIKLTKDDEADSVDSSKYRGLQIKQMIDGIFFNQSKYIKKMLKKFGLEYSKPTKISMSMEIKLTKDDEADSVDSSKYQGTKMPNEYQKDYKKTRSYAPKLYNDPNMSDSLRDIYMALESIYVHEERTINPSFYNDHSDDSVAKFTAIEQIEPHNSRLPALDDIRNLIHRRTVHEKINKKGNTIYKLPNQIETSEPFDHLGPCKLVIRENVYSTIENRDHTQAVIALMLCFLENRQPFNLAFFIVKRMYFFRDRRDKVLPYGMILTRLFDNLKANIAQGSFDEHYKLVHKNMSSLKAKQPKRPPPKRTKNVGKSKRTQLTTSSSTKSLPSDNEDFPSTKLLRRSYHRALKDDPNMSKEQRETKGMFKKQPNETNPLPPPRKKSLSPPQAPSKSISSKSTHYTSSSSPSESPTPTHVAPPPKLRFVILIKLKPQELPLIRVSPNDPYVQTIDNWPPGPSNPSPPPRVSRPPLGFLNLPLGFELFPSTQPLFVNINNNNLSFTTMHHR
uniref:Retrovirus-related Pol polyprotein from transposon TNT 1-94 n=1 Tax=Tanacetum cinerariifolium TaxID=118510 RepID=A0A6L2MU55_TANCI|nr:retrovirus-related Pol polyprotein from transposon TNT 1-94 [Tanacetum cinerariifolium]